MKKKNNGISTVKTVHGNLTQNVYACPPEFAAILKELRMLLKEVKAKK
jgi:hypothetical protein